MKKVAVIVLNNFTSDSRVLKEAVSLRKFHYDAQVIALHEETLETNFITNEGVPVERIKLRTKKWAKITFIQFIKYLEFIYLAIKKYRKYDIFHCNDIDALPIGVIIKLLFNRKVKIVYDAHELETELSFVHKKSRKFIIKKIEAFFIRYADTVITVSPSIANFYQKQYNILPELIFNCPGYQTVVNNNVIRKNLNIPNNKNVFLYIGGFINGRLIKQIIESFKSLKDSNNAVVFIGSGILLTEIKQAAEQFENIYYHPAISPDKLIDFISSADWSLVLIENVSLSYYYSMPNKLFESIMAEIPVITTPLLELKRIVQGNNIGIITEGYSTDDIINSIKSTETFEQNETLKQKFLELKKEYNWEQQEKKLISLYNNLFIEN
ncbi:MAG: glycosyltransferase [Bacteroidales bacterium]|nr:glycosyltransferase [Bacteroidales bacterium]